MGSPSKWISGANQVHFRVSKIFFWKIMVFQWKNENGSKMVKKSRKSSKIFPGIISYYCYHINSSNWNFWIFRLFCAIFRHFWRPSRRANFRGSRVREIPFSCLHVKIKCWEHPWMPSAHPQKSKAYPLKLTLKKIFFSTMEFLGFFAPKCQILVRNTLQNYILHTLRLRGLYRIIRDSQERPLYALNWVVFDQNPPKEPKMLWNQLFYFVYFAYQMIYI